MLVQNYALHSLKAQRDRTRFIRAILALDLRQKKEISHTGVPYMGDGNARLLRSV